jgi:hypothetical protein
LNKPPEDDSLVLKKITKEKERAFREQVWALYCKGLGLCVTDLTLQGKQGMQGMQGIGCRCRARGVGYMKRKRMLAGAVKGL